MSDEYINKAKISDFFDGIYDCADLAFEPNDHPCKPEDCKGCKSGLTVKALKKAILALPAAPVQEVVKGKWIETEERFEDDWGFTIVQHCACSVCGFTQSKSNTYAPGGVIRKSNFCPNCGADMRCVSEEDG